MKTVLAWLIVFSLILLMLLSGCVKIVPVYAPFDPDQHITTFVCKPGEDCVKVEKKEK